MYAKGHKGLVFWGVFLGVWLGCLASGFAKPAPTIAVMPFRDLTGKGKPHIGEAIRETVAADLKSLAGVRIVERGNLDRLLKEMRLQVHLKEVQDETAAKLGKVVGAQIMVIGSYQEETPLIRLTARFVRVETSEVVGSAKVDGPIKQFFRLQDRVTAELLRSSGMPELARKVVDGSDSRPELKNTLGALDLYGQAVTAENDEQRMVLLSSAIAMEEQFSYAIKDLAEVEARIEKYKTEQKRILDEKIVAMRKAIVAETRPELIGAMTYELLLLLKSAKRYYALQKEARRYLDSLPAGSVVNSHFENCSTLLLEADQIVRDHTSLVHDGENFMKRAPGSTRFEFARQTTAAAIEELRKTEEGKQGVLDRFKATPTLYSWDLCTMAAVYYSQHQFREAQRLFGACLQKPTEQNKSYFSMILIADMYVGDFAAMRKHLAEYAKIDPKAARSLKTAYASMMPEDERTP